MDVSETFGAIVGHLEYSMFIVTTRAGDERLGCLVGFATQTSIDPPRFLFCLSRNNRTWRLGRDAPLFAVHAVSSRDGDLAELFGGRTGDDVDKFALTGWHEEEGGIPVLDRCENWFVGRVLARLDAGDHEAYLLEPVAAHAGRQDEDFTFHRAVHIHAGHAP